MTATSSTAASSSTSNAFSVVRLKEFLWAHPALSVFLLALIVRVFISTVLTRYFSGTLVLDDTTYHAMAAQMASGQTDHWDDFTNTLYWATATFMLPVTGLYKIFGPVTIAAQLLIAVVGSFAAFFVARLAGEFLEKKWAFAAGAIVALLPSQAFWSSMLMKDAFVWFVLSALALTLAVAARSTGPRLFCYGGIAALLLVALSYLRLHTLVVASWALIIGCFFGIKLFRAWRIGVFVATALIVPMVLGGIGLAGIGLVTNAGSLEDRRFQNALGANTAVVDISQPPPGSGVVPPETQQEVSSLETDAASAESKAQALLAAAEEVENGRRERAERLRERAADLAAEAESLRAAAAAALAEAGTPVAVGDAPLDPDLAHLPRGLSVMMLEPLPLPFSGSPALKLARLESLVWYPLLALAAIGLWNARHHARTLAFPVIAGAGILVTYALTEGNIGTAHRHRGEFVWVVALLAALGMKHLMGSRSSDDLA